MKSKKIFNNELIGVVLMIAGQLSFAINDSFVKLSVLELNSNLSTFNVIFIRGLITTFIIYLYRYKSVKFKIIIKNYC